jgi:hypothetical protein
MGRCGLDSSWSGQGIITLSFEHDNAPSDPINNNEFLDQLSY